MPKYDFRCDNCGCIFELSRAFDRASDPAVCPRDGAEATRLFSPPLDVLVYGREPVASTGRVTIPPGALSCHDHGPPPGQESSERSSQGGSRWHAHGYEDGHSDGDAGADGGAHGHDGGHGHAHGPGHSHSHGHGHPHGHRH